MNKENYRMDFEERRQYVYDKAIELLENDDYAFIEGCESLDSWNGFLGDERCYSMYDIDELLGEMKPSELFEKVTDDFDVRDKYFYFSIYGIESCDNIIDVYRDCTTADELLDNLIDEYNHVGLSINSELDNLVNILYNEDFGIDVDFDYEDIDEDFDEDELPEETDDEFKERIDSHILF